MTDVAEQADPGSRKRSPKPMLIALGASVLLAGGGFFATYSGLLGLPVASHGPDAPMPGVAFVPVDPLIISLGPGGSGQHLRFAATLEVTPEHEGEVALLKPRIIDVLNGYLRAVDVAQLEDPAALVQLRAQMLRRIQIVTGEGRVRDLLVTEFVLN